MELISIRARSWCEDIRAQDEYAGIRVKLRATLARPWCRCRWMSVSATRCPLRRRKITFPVMLGMAAPKLRAYSRENRRGREIGGHWNGS